MTDLSPEEQKQYASRPIYRLEVPRDRVEQQFVRVPTPDYDAEGYRKAIAAEASANPHHDSLLNRINETARIHAEGLRTAERMFGPDRRPGDIVVEQ